MDSLNQGNSSCGDVAPEILNYYLRKKGIICKGISSHLRSKDLAILLNIDGR